MTSASIRRLMAAGGLGAALMATTGAAQAQTAGNPPFQAFFTTTCGSSTGALATLCAVSNGGNLSTDSESSLNPNQTAVAAGNALAKAQALAAATEKRLEAVRDEADGKPGADAGTVAAFGPWSIFGSVEGEWFDQSRPAFANERGFDGKRYRATIGLDRRLSAASLIGIMLGYDDYSSEFDADRAGTAFTPQGDAGSVDSKDFTVTIFGSVALASSLWLDASAGIGFSDYDFRRNAQFQESSRTVPQTNVRTRGSANGREYFASVGAGYDLADGAFSFGPYVRGRFTRTRIDRYTEEDLGGSGLAMNVSASRATSLTSIMGGRASYAISTSWGVIVPQARFEYEHEFEDDPRATATSFVLDAAGNQFRVASDSPDRNYFNAGASLLFVLPNGWMPFVDYEGLIGYSDFKRHRVTAGLRVEL
jgi:uncharacterized protein with beta-barrel porin domain